MCYTQGSDLPIAGFVAIEKKPVSDPWYERARAMLLSSTTGILRFSETFGNSALSFRNCAGEKCWGAALMQDVWHQRGGEPHDEIHIVRKRQRGCF